MRDDRKRLKDIVELVSEKAVTQKRSDWPYLGLEHLAAGEPRLLGQARSDTSVSVNSVFQAGDILFGKLRPNLRKTLQVGFPGYCSTDILVFRAQADHNAEYVARLFQHESIAVAAVASAEGTKMPRTSWARLSGELAFVPPLPEQRRIAQILDTLDRTIESTQRIIEKLQATRQGLLHDLLTRGLDEHGQLRDPEQNPELFNETKLGLLPREWEVKTFGEACSLIRDGTHLPPKRVASGPLLLSVQNMVKGEFILTEQDTRISWNFFRQMHSSWQIQPGDALLAVVGATLGKTASVPLGMPPFTLQRSVAVMRGIEGILDSKFLQIWLQSSTFQIALWAGVNQTAQPGIYLNQLAELILPVPSINEQERIISTLSASTKKLSAEHSALSKLHALKRGLMDDLLTGRVRVPLSEAER